MGSLFNQFTPPTLFGIPLVIIAMLFPWLLPLSPSNRWISNRLVTVQSLFLNAFTAHILTPMNKPAHKWALLIVTVMVFLLGMNLMGLLPYTFTPTTQLPLNLGLAIPLWLATVIVGFRNQFSASLAHFLPEGTPTLLIPILIIIETISLLIRPIALGVRLMANLTAGHLLIQLISAATMFMISFSTVVSLISFAVLILLTILEIAVAMIQAYVFVLLFSLYLHENS
uniref:ATP synthase subunit a n=1 Tax=Polypedates braueri TaxID=1198049 RepID=A0A140DED8_POLBR|nr:ATP synthase F0 subunit 6 [Polypedates braueri]AMK46135.1 ATP synthase subunit 6 [Polypedates braueri]QCI03845.1 ATP synthase subunit 6 [Polypedates braueri]UKT59896.1 ATP synthase subunit 6 [Polypedates braueri]